MTKCMLTKDLDLEKYLVIDCEGDAVSEARTLHEANALAEGLNACGVVKILRLCTPSGEVSTARLETARMAVDDADYTEVSNMAIDISEVTAIEELL